MIFVDTNILVDLASRPSRWTEWSRQALAAARVEDDLVSNHIVLAELAPGFRSVQPLVDLLGDVGLRLLPLTEAAAFRAGRAHAAYRATGGKRLAILADFLIGGHAAELEAKLLTRDKQRFATYFPELTLITPETDNG